MNTLRRFPRFCVLSFLCACLFSFAQPIASAFAVQAQDEQAKVLAEIEKLKKQTEETTNDPLLYFKLSELHQQLYQWQEAAEALERATRIKPDFAAAHRELGWCYVALSKYAEALGAHKQALAHATDSQGSRFFGKIKLPAGPSLADAQLAVGFDLALMREYDDAIAAYQEAMALNPKFEDALYEIGRVYVAQGKKDEAMGIARKLSSYLGEWLLKELALTRPAANTPVVKAAPAEDRKTEPLKMTATVRPKILYKERAKYTEEARTNRVRGVVVLNMTFFADGRISDFRVLRPLPYGLTAMALIAAEKIRFEPALRDGQQVSVRGNIEFAFTLY